jgi:predicted RNA-binding Zn-ribbon protein involved in translation (DUF1610 family)
MPKIACSCGFVHDLTPAPDKGWVTIPDSAYDDLVEDHIQQHSIAGHGIPKTESIETDKWDACASRIARRTGRLFECPKCGRILWKKEGSDIYREFTPDEPRA